MPTNEEKKAALRADAAVLTRLYSYRYTCIMVAAERAGLFDSLREPTTVEAIAQIRGYQLEALQRLVFGLEGCGLAYREGDKWQLTRHGRRVVESDSNIQAQVRLTARYLPSWLTLGEPEALSEPGNVGGLNAARTWETLDFQQVMQVNVPGVVKLLLESDRIPVTGTVVDVGGGMGDVLASLLTSYPKLVGVLVELPTVAMNAMRWLSATYVNNVIERIAARPGDMFDSSFRWEGDVNLLVNIIHDWPDRAAIEVLKKCALTAPKTIIVERVVIPGREFMVAMYDLHMMAVTGGKQRTLAELTSLAERSGLRVAASDISDSTYSVVELVRD